MSYIRAKNNKQNSLNLVAIAFLKIPVIFLFFLESTVINIAENCQNIELKIEHKNLLI